MLLLSKKLSLWRRPKQESSSRTGRALAFEVLQELLVALIALIAVLIVVAFFYLYCFPWLNH